MLTESQQLQIELEERHRLVVRAELAKDPDGSKHQALRFLNSAFGLWLLSAVFISGVSWAYSRWDAARKAAVVKQERIERLDTEIPYRIGRVTRFLAFADAQELADVAAAELRFALPELGGRRALFPEFKDVPLYILVFDLMKLLPQDDRNDLDSLMIASRELFDLDVKLTDFTREPSIHLSLNERTLEMSRFLNQVWPQIRDTPRYRESR